MLVLKLPKTLRSEEMTNLTKNQNFHSRLPARMVFRKHLKKGSVRDQYKQLLSKGFDVDTLACDYLLEQFHCPYYNIYDSAIPFLLKVDLTKIYFKHVKMMFPAIQLRFTGNWLGLHIINVTRCSFKDANFHGLSIRWCWGEHIQTGEASYFVNIGGDERNVLESVQASVCTNRDLHTQTQRVFSNDEITEIVRLVISVLLVDDEELLTWDFLKKDIGREISLERKLERMKQRHHFGKNLRVETGLTIVEPHPQTYWTGKGRTEPVVKIRKGWVNNKKPFYEG